MLSLFAVGSVFGGYALAQRALEADVRARMERRAEILRTAAETGGTPALVASLRRFDQRGLRTFSYYLIDAAGHHLFGPFHIPRLSPGWHELPLTDLDDDAVEMGRILTAPMPNGETLSIIADVDYIAIFDRIIAIALAVSFTLMSILALVGGLYLDRIVRQRLAAMNETAAALANLPDLQQRVPLSPRHDEFDALAITFNGMLDRIGGLLSENMRVTGYIAHDLRAPLVKLAERLADARQLGGSANAHLLDAAEDDISGILELFDAFLAVGQQQAQALHLSGSFDLSALVSELAESFAVLAEASGRTFRARIERNVEMTGKEALITQLLVNLIENAVRHTPKGTAIMLSLTVEDEFAHLFVSDNAKEISTSDRAAVTIKKRSALSTDRERLGLKLAQSIAKNHGGSLSNVTTCYGTTVHVVVPIRS